MNKAKVILASGSPRRREILTQIGVDFRVVVSNDEEHPKSTDPFDFPRENAMAKALAVSAKEPGAYVLGFDTLVFLDGAPLGKPKDEKEALEMLQKLNGRGHLVVTGVAIAQGVHGLLAKFGGVFTMWWGCLWLSPWICWES